MKPTTSENYRKRLLKVIDYMHQHISDDLDVNTLADVACMSPYHFHRIYRYMAQETVNATVRRMRLQAAASELIRSDLSLPLIAKKMAYSSQEAFSRAFLKEFGETPGQYRQTKHMSQVSLGPYVAMLPAGPDIQCYAEQNTMFTIEIQSLPATSIVGMYHQGDYMEIGQAFEKMAQYAVAHQLFTEQTKSIGIYYDDPKSVDKSQLKSLAGLSVAKPAELEDEAVSQVTIPEGEYATLLFKGSYAELEKAYDWLYGQWLPESGREAGDFPPFEEYLNDPKTTPPAELLTRIHCRLA